MAKTEPTPSEISISALLAASKDAKASKKPKQPLTYSPVVLSAGPPWVMVLARGALITLVMGICGWVNFSLAALAFPTWTTAHWVSTQLIQLGAMVGVWLATSPAPHDRTWLRRLRWAARAGLLLALGLMMLGVFGRAATGLVEAQKEVWVPIYGAVHLLSLAGSIAGLWYLKRLSRAIADRFLVKAFSAILWVLVVFLLLYCLMGSLKWNDWSSQRLTEMTGPGPASWARFSWIVRIWWWASISALLAFFCYLSLRLWKRLLKLKATLEARPAHEDLAPRA